MFTMNGIMFGIAMMIFVGGFFGLMVWSSNMKPFKKLIVQILICAGIFFFCAIGMSGEDYNWNNGYCVECGTKYQAIGKSRHGSTTYYSCPNCFHEANR